MDYPFEFTRNYGIVAGLFPPMYLGLIATDLITMPVGAAVVPFQYLGQNIKMKKAWKCLLNGCESGVNQFNFELMIQMIRSLN
ncbi:MAG: hypothetical protein KA715_08790 [Xanthomonadaceae bacterium]|nr:hypothetical protein [Xanthomonadaceae bacterium]